MSFSLFGAANTTDSEPINSQKKKPIRYDWDRLRVEDDRMARHKDDVAKARELTERTLTCADCGGRRVIDGRVDGVGYCDCPGGGGAVYGHKTEGVDWTPFLEKKDIIVWRQEHPDNPGMFVYKMYGNFDDISANEFLEVQLDLTDFRLSWDQNTNICHVVDEEVDEANNSISQIYYWEVQWPRFFSNRDYVCNR